MNLAVNNLVNSRILIAVVKKINFRSTLSIVIIQMLWTIEENAVVETIIGIQKFLYNLFSTYCLKKEKLSL